MCVNPQSVDHRRAVNVNACAKDETEGIVPEMGNTMRL